MTITLTPDEDGFIGRECPSCERYFKVRPGTGLTEQTFTYCPYCENKDDANAFATKEQVAFAQSLAMRALTGQLNQSLARLNKTIGGGLVQMKITTQPADEPPVAAYQEARLETPVTCSNCSLEYKVYGVFASCPDCGTHNTKEIFTATLSTLRGQLDNATDDTRADILKNAIGAFDAFGKATTERTFGTATGFQNLQRAEAALQSQQRSLRAHTTREEWVFLTRAFQKRHALVHNLGVIDEQYLQRCRDTDAMLGHKVRLNNDEVERTLDLLERLAASISTAVVPPSAEARPTTPRNPYRLTNTAQRLATLLFRHDTDESHGPYTDARAARAELELEQLVFDAALSELVDHRLVDNEHGWLSSTHYMPLALPDQIAYSPTDDDKNVATTLLDAGALQNEDLLNRVGIPVDRLNQSVKRLKDKQAISVFSVMGAAPFEFAEARPTGETIRYLKKLE